MTDHSESTEDDIRAACKCLQSCFFSGLTGIAKSFAEMPQKDKLASLRAMLLALASPAGDSNKLTRSSRPISRNTEQEHAQFEEDLFVEHFLRKYCAYLLLD